LQDDQRPAWGSPVNATICVYRGTWSLKSVLASEKGNGRSFAQIREAAGTAARSRDGIV
jgi:hypothetical protein